MLQNAQLLAKIGADTAENERNVAEILPKIGNYPTGRLTPWRRGGAGRRLQRLARRAGAERSAGLARAAAARAPAPYGAEQHV